VSVAPQADSPGTAFAVLDLNFAPLSPQTVAIARAGAGLPTFDDPFSTVVSGSADSWLAVTIWRW